MTNFNDDFNPALAPIFINGFPFYCDCPCHYNNLCIECRVMPCKQVIFQKHFHEKYGEEYQKFVEMCLKENREFPIEATPPYVKEVLK